MQSIQRGRRLVVFTGSAFGNHPIFPETAVKVGKHLVAHQVGLVYGGGCVGLMGLVAKTVYEGGGEVIGVIPRFLKDIEGACDFGTQIEVDSMHERKQRMCDEGDGFLALAGGVGTFEEIVEQITWRQLKQHNKPSMFLNTLNFWRSTIAQLDQMQSLDFITEEKPAPFLVANEVDDIVPIMFATQSSAVVEMRGRASRM